MRGFGETRNISIFQKMIQILLISMGNCRPPSRYKIFLHVIGYRLFGMPPSIIVTVSSCIAYIQSC